MRMVYFFLKIVFVDKTKQDQSALLKVIRRVVTLEGKERKKAHRPVVLQGADSILFDWAGYMRWVKVHQA